MKKEIEALKEKIEIIPSEDVDYNNSGCCGKDTFSSHEEAMSSIKSFQNGKKPIRAYECSLGNWHLTSMSKKIYDKYKYKQ